MKSFEDIILELNSNNLELENEWKKRKKFHKKRKIFTNICSIIFIVGYYYLLGESNYNFLQIALYLIIGTAFIRLSIYYVLYFITKFPEKDDKLKIKFKEIAIKKLADNFFADATYSPHDKIYSSDYDKGEYEYYNSYHSEDYICGKIDDCNLIMSEVLTEKEYTDSDGNRHAYNVFHGLFAKIELNKMSKTHLKIVSDFDLKHSWNGTKINLDDDEFTKVFTVYSTDELLAVRILTADIMQMLLEFKKSFNIKYDVYINNGIMYLRFHTGPMFEMGSYKGELWNQKLLKKYFNILKFTSDLTKELINVINDKEL